MTEEHLAKEAARLKTDDVLLAALHELQQDTFKALAVADADDTTAILRLQQRVEVISDFLLQLERFIVQGKPQEDGRTSVV